MKQKLSWLADFRKECPVCNSAGKIVCNCNENSELSCPNCHGTGVVSVRKTTSQTYEVPCDYAGCNKGKVRCGICGGTGKNADGTVCKACHGTGRSTCHVCGGVGKIKRVKQETWLEHEQCHICGGRGMVECYQCHGTKERVCPECKGKGTVLNIKTIVLLAMMLVAMVAMPILVAVVALLSLGYCLFMLEQKNKDQIQMHTNKQPDSEHFRFDDAGIEFSEVE